MSHSWKFWIRALSVRALGVLVALAIVSLAAVWIRPPEVVRIAAAYTAKMTCSNVFLAGRDPSQVLREDVQAPGHPLLRLMWVRVDREHGVVRAGLIGFIGDGLAQWRPREGCAVLPDGKLGTTVSTSNGRTAPTSAAATARLWPNGEGARIDTALDQLLTDDRLTGPGMRAVVVVSHGRIVAERYAGGFDSRTPQLGWSMTKSVIAGLIGILVKDGRLELDQLAGWSAHDGRDEVRIADLLAMSSGLRFNEGYGAVSDVTRMLYLEVDMATFARNQPLLHPVGTVWSYSSGTAVILARLFQDAAGGDAIALIRHRLFDLLGMNSAIIETDEQGTLVGSSYMYATPHDWARYGQLLCADGIWKGQEVLPRGYVSRMASSASASGGAYGRGLVWRRLPQGDRAAADTDADATTERPLPADLFWMAGHDGQYIAVIPSRQLVLVRLGLTPSRDRYRPEPLLRSVLAALP